MNLYISDLDGTLLNEDAKISNNTDLILNRAIKNGLKFSIATARTPATFVDKLKNIPITTPVVAMNGAAIYDIFNNKYLLYHPIKNKLANEIKSFLKENNINSFIYTIKNNHLEVYYDNLNNPCQRAFYDERKHSTLKTFHQGDCDRNAEILYFTLMDKKDIILSIYEKLNKIQDLYVDCYSDIYSEDIYNLEIYSINSSKANGIKYLKEKENAEKLIVFGDNINDIPMFKEADECYAVSNAVPQLKELATKIIGSNRNDSVPHFIENHTKKRV